MKKLLLLPLLITALFCSSQNFTKDIIIGNLPVELNYIYNELPASTQEMVLNLDTSEYKIVAGTVRNKGTGLGWVIIDDTDHTPINVDNVSYSTTNISIDYTSLGATEVVTFITGVDETYAGLYFSGSSVGLDKSYIYIKNSNRAAVFGTITHLGNGNFVKSGNIDNIAYSLSSGVLTVNHPYCNSYYSITTDQGYNDSTSTRWQPFGNAISTTQSKFKMYNMDGTQKTIANPEINRMTFTRYLSQTELQSNGKNPNNVYSPTGNIWFFGIMKVN